MQKLRFILSVIVLLSIIICCREDNKTYYNGGACTVEFLHNPYYDKTPRWYFNFYRFGTYKVDFILATENLQPEDKQRVERVLVEGFSFVFNDVSQKQDTTLYQNTVETTDFDYNIRISFSPDQPQGEEKMFQVEENTFTVRQSSRYSTK